MSFKLTANADNAYMLRRTRANVLLSHQIFIRYRALTLILFPLMFAGCGGGEDFSKPPDILQGRVAPPAPENPAPGTPPVAAASPETKAAAGADSTAPPAAGEAENAEATVAATSANPAPPATTPPATTPPATTAPSAPATDAGKTNDSATKPPAESSGDSEVMTASGKSAEDLKKKKEENSENSIAENAGGLLDSLQGTSDSGGGASSPLMASGGDGAVAEITRFGRSALSGPEWLQIAARLSRRFFVASTQDGNRLIASSGERTAGIVSTRLDFLKTQLLSTRPVSVDPLLQSIHTLPGIINSMELTGDGATALIGTTDGRLLVRSAASTADWDLFARDLFQYRDDHRRTSRLSEEALVVVRSLPDGKVLTVDGNGLCSLWKMDAVVHEPLPLQQITLKQLESKDLQTIPASPMASFQVSGFQVLSVSVSDDGRFGAIVSSSETITIFETETGIVVDELKATQFADTQPVCVAFVPDKGQILAGLADGRVMLRAFGKDATPVSSVNDKGETIDYETVFAPDFQEKADPVTTLFVIPETTTVYYGSLSGHVGRLNLAQRKLESIEKRHEGAVIELRMTPSGILSIGDDRRAVLFDMPLTLGNPQPGATRVYQLPADTTLTEEQADPSTSLLETKKSTRPARRPAPPMAAEPDLSLTGIRPSDSVLALYSHQLRVSENPVEQMTLRKSILEHLGRGTTAATLGADAPLTPGVPTFPTYQAESEFVFSGDWEPVRLFVSDDGLTATMSHRSKPGVEVRDLATNIVLRRWTQALPMRQFFVAPSLQLVQTTHPASSMFQIKDGQLVNDPTVRYLTCAQSPGQDFMVKGTLGYRGVAASSLTRIEFPSGNSKSGHELFESMITSISFSMDGGSLYVSARGRDHVTLHELDPLTFAVRHELAKEGLSGVIGEEPTNALDGPCGDVFSVASETNKVLLTFGTFADGPQIRLWRRSSKGWPLDSRIVIRDAGLLPDMRHERPMVLVGNLESKIAVLTTTGLSIFNAKKQSVDASIPIPNVGNHRPALCYSPDNEWLLAGDGEGNVWAISLQGPTRKPLRFPAHTGPIAGMAVSPNGKYLLTAGEDNRLRSWRIDGMLSR
jgi:WD40 repeat protein